MFVNVTLPVLLTLPEKKNGWPGGTGSKHVLVTLMPGVRVFEQMALVVAVGCPDGGGQFTNESVPWATNVFTLGLQGFKLVQLPLNEATWPTLRVGKVATRLGMVREL